MDLSHEFDVPTDIDSAWALFTDPARVAACMPGAKLDGTSDDGELRGRVKVKLGAIVTEFRGKAHFAEQDGDQHGLRLVAEGSEVRGASSASAEISVQLTATGDDATHAAVSISLTTAGKIAQFGRNVLQDVSERLLGQFLKNVERQLGAGDAPQVSNARESAHTPPPATTATTAATTAATSDDAIDLFRLAGPVVLKRYLALAAATVAGLVVGWCIGRAGRRREFIPVPVSLPARRG